MDNNAQTVKNISESLGALRKKRPNRKQTKVKQEKKTISEVIEELDKLKLKETKPKGQIYILEDGKTKINTDGLKEGNAVFVADIDGNRVTGLPTGIYPLKGGNTIEVEEGQIVRVFKTIKASKLIKFKGVKE